MLRHKIPVMYQLLFQGNVVCSDCQVVRFLFVFDLLFNLFMIALWPSVGKELSPWFFTCAVFCFRAVLIVGVPFPFGVSGRVCNSIVSVPDH